MIAARADARLAMSVSGRALLAVVALAVLGLPVDGTAQAGGTDQMSRQELVQRLQQQVEDRIAEELDLTPEQRERLPGVLAEFGRARGELVPLRVGFMARVGALLLQDGSEEEAMALIREGRRLRDREAALLLAEEDRLLEILDPSQVLLLQVLRDQLGDLIRMAGGGPHGGQLPPGIRGLLPESPTQPD